MPLAIFILGAAIFAQGTSELMLAGLLTEVATAFDVSVPQAGLLISAFAIGMLVGAPILALATMRWPRRTTLLIFLAVFSLSHAAGALAPDYWTLFVTRVISAFVYAGFWAVSIVTVFSLVPVNVRGKAMSILAGGLTIATIFGLPLGALIGQQFGWRSVFWVVAVMSAVAMIGVLATVPGGRPTTEKAPDLRRELRGMANPRVWLAYSITALGTAGLFVSFSYLEPLLTRTTGLATSWVPAILALYGVGAVVGITIGGRTADRHPVRTMYIGMTGLIVTSIGLALLADHLVPTIVLIFLLGAFGFGPNPTFNSWVFTLAKNSPTLASSTNVSAFNTGITTGPWLGGLAIGAGYGYPSVAWIGALLGALSLLAIAAATRRTSAAPDLAPTTV
ncbi:Cmx/CmrA family chloramphenicol efflux MFS transporter [Nonomuraea longicatena]|uniref:MFS transporter n=1 Tax=Nonomuraea longicatena TaxID=83682 RepID=A0ABN1R252_9ACTN